MTFKTPACGFAALLSTATLSTALSVAQPAAALDALGDAVRPVLPYPDAGPDGELPADNSAGPRWFVVWPSMAGEPRIVVKANPLNPDVQRAAAEAMDRINQAVAAAERRAQQAYEKALEELRRTGTTSGLVDTVTLDDEGVEGERIDAELELTIELQPAASFTIATSRPPVVSPGSNGALWIVNVPANVYRQPSGGTEHFRAAEAWVYFEGVARPEVRPGDVEPLHVVDITAPEDALAVVIRGNETLLSDVVAGADWQRVANWSRAQGAAGGQRH